MRQYEDEEVNTNNKSQRTSFVMRQRKRSRKKSDNSSSRLQVYPQFSLQFFFHLLKREYFVCCTCQGICVKLGQSKAFL